MNENSVAISAPTTPENANSSIHKVKSGVSNILFSTISKWFSPSDQNGNLRRKRESESDIELTDIAHGTVAPTAGPPAKRFRCVEEQVEIESHPTTSKNLYSTIHFSSSTPTITTTPTRRKLLEKNSSPFNFSEHTLVNSRRQSQIEPATIAIDDNGDNSTDEESNDNVIVTDSLSRELSNRRRLNIPPTARPASRSSNPMTIRTSHISRDRFSANHTIGHDLTKDDDLEQDALFNGTVNESASESEDSSSRTTFTQPNKYATKRPQSSAGRINTSLVRDDEPDQNQRRLSGLFGTGSKRLRATNNGLMNFSAHLQTNKSLFSDKNMPKSLNNSTTSLNSLNRRQSLNASLYGSTSALSDSRLLNTNSPFYSGRTMYGGASAYSRRAISSQRTLRVPTQIRPSSSLSTLYSSTNSLANVDPNTSALSNTAKRILDLMNQCTTPLADVKKMASNANHSPALVNHRKRFDDNDMMLNRSIRLSTPKTPYSRPGVNSARKSPPTNELQVPTMSQLLQMKKILQTNTEKVREVATASSSILNQTGEYKLPDNSNSESVSARQTKIRNKITNTRASTKNVHEEYVQEVNLPNIALPAMKNIPDIGLSFAKPKITSFDAQSASITPQPVSTTQPASPSLVNSTITKITQSPSPKEENLTRLGKSQFSFSSPTQLKLPLFDKNIDPINNFKFSEPISVGKTPTTSQSTFGGTQPSTSSNVKITKVDTGKTLAQLKNASVLEALNIPTTLIASSTSSTLTAAIPAQQSLSALFKSSSKQWECSCCMIKNDDKNDKCVACETLRKQPAPKAIEQTTSAPFTNSFGSQFKANANTWECSTCMIRNKSDAQKCVACETAKPGGFAKSASALPKLTVPSSDQGFKSIVVQQSARWECTACMTRNDANRKKCECCEQAKPGTSSDATPAFSFGSSASSVTPQFSFGVPFNEKVASTVVPIGEVKSKVGEIKSSFSFGVQSGTSVTDGPAKTLSFGDQSKEKDKEKKSDTPATTFSFGVKSSIISNENDLSASDKIVSTPALSGFKFGAPLTQTKPVTAAGTAVGSNHKPTTDEKAKETKSSELVFGSQSKNTVISLPSPVTSVVPANSMTTTNSPIIFGSLKNDQKLFGSVDTAPNVTQAKPVFAITTTSTLTSTNVQSSAAQSSPLTNKVTPSSTIAPVFAFGQTQNVAKGGFSFTPNTVVKDKHAFPMPDFAQSQIKSATPTLTFGSSSVTVTTASAAPAPFANTFFFGQAATSTTVPSESVTSSKFGSTSSTPASGFNFGSTSTSSQPISNTFGTQQPQAQATSVFPSVATAITSSLPTEPATSPFMFRSTATIEAPSFGQSAAPSFGQSSTTTPIPPFGCFGTQTPTSVAPFSANTNAIGSTITNNAAPPTFGTASPFGSNVNVNPTPAQNFGNTGNNGLNTFGTSNSFGNPSSGFAMIHSAPTSSDEPSAKKHSPGFGALSNSSIQKPPAFSFGDSSSSNNSKTSFPFTANASPNFNFSGSLQTNSAQPYKFGSASATPNPVFSFGSNEAKSPNAPFQFAGSSDVTNNLFAPQSTSTNSAATQPRRKIRARRTPR